MRRIILLFILLLPIVCLAKQTKINSKEAMSRPYVVLISLDGFRHDYVKKYKLPFLRHLKETGLSFEALIPAYPSLTFPNHLTLITGLLPKDHQIVDNSFYSPSLQKMYSYKNPTSYKDSRFYNGTTLWSLTGKNDMVSASFYWPGSETVIDNFLPSYYKSYDESVPNSARVEEIITWLNLPVEKRPHLITAYFSDVDHEGHRRGPENTQTSAKKLDMVLQSLDNKLQRLDIPVNLIVVSDHGMASLSQNESYNIYHERVIKEQLKQYRVIGEGPIIHIYSTGSNSDNLQKLIHSLNQLRLPFTAYLRQDIPSQYQLNDSRNIGDAVIIAEPHFTLLTRDILGYSGGHGYDPALSKDMHGIFYAKGPDFPKGTTLPAQSNTTVFPIIANVLGLEQD